MEQKRKIIQDGQHIGDRIVDADAHVDRYVYFPPPGWCAVPHTQALDVDRQELERTRFGVQTPAPAPPPAAEPWAGAQARRYLTFMAVGAQRRQYHDVPPPPKTMALAVEKQRQRGQR